MTIIPESHLARHAIHDVAHVHLVEDSSTAAIAVDVVRIPGGCGADDEFPRTE
jgi:hypothetical protein